MDYLQARQLSLELHGKFCYASDNNFAYKADLFYAQPNEVNMNRMYGDSKEINFVPTYDKWCLYCDNKSATKRCKGCKTVYFCNADCQKKAWPIHKKHCKRNLFTICASCGEQLNQDEKLTCDGCPVSWCSEYCKNKIYEPHKDIDCKNFAKLFPK
jgi:hypothetical protein